MDLSKLKELINKILNSKDKKKSRDLLVTLLILGVVIIIAANMIFSGKKAENISPREDDKFVAAAKINSAEDRDELSRKLEAILSKIQGAGSVSVMITYAGSKETVPAYDTKTNKSNTDEKDNAGGTRNQSADNSEAQVVFEESSGTKKPVVLKEIQPEIKGVLIVSEGASTGVVYESLIKSTQVVLDIPVHKIQVVQKGK